MKKNYMRHIKFFAILSIVALAVMPARVDAGAASIVIKSAREMIEYFAKSGGSKTTKELAKYGGEKFVIRAFETIEKQGGQKCVERAVMYSKIYGPNALKSIEISPVEIVKALDKTPTQYKPYIFSIVQKNSGKALAGKLEKEGCDFLVLEAKYPKLGFEISKLGNTATRTALDNMAEREVVYLSRNVKPLQAVEKADPAQFGKFLETLKAAPRKTVELLEKNPKVLFTGAALTAFLSAKKEIIEEVIKPTTTGPIQYFLYGVGTLGIAWLAFKLRQNLMRRRGNFQNI